MVTALAGRGHDVTVFASSPGRATLAGAEIVDSSGDATLNALRVRIAKALRDSGREPVRAAEAYSLLLNETLLALLTSSPRFDFVYERHSLWSIAGLQYAEQKDVPHLLEVNAPLLEQQSAYRDLEFVEAAQAIESMLFEGSDRVFVTTTALVDYVHARGASRSRVRVLPCGASAELFTRRARVSDGARSEFVVGFLGSLKPWHGLDVLLDAFGILHQRDASYRLLIVGDGPQRAEIEMTCRSRGLDSAVTMTGSVDHSDVGTYLARMDVGVASYPELDAFYFSPLKVWEYAAASVPIVASESGELPRLFPHKEAALLHPRGNARKLARHIDRLRQNPALAARLARRAHLTARLHTWDRLAARVERAAKALLQ
jgi:glycosyltransferase involved in cell wall biosynthesis